jgi:hypothetical protein
MSNISSFSKKVRFALQVLMVLTPIYFIIWYWLHVDTAVVHEAYMFGIPNKNLTLNTLSKALGFCISVIPIFVIMLMYYQLMKLFKNYEQGNVFNKVNAKKLKTLGKLLFTLAAVNFVCAGLMSLALSFQSPPGERFFMFSLGNAQIFPIIVGLVVLGISYVMEEAHRLEEETSYTI